MVDLKFNHFLSKFKIHNVFCFIRFPEDELLQSFSVLGLRPLSFLSKDEQKSFGNDEIAKLADYYGSSCSVEWTEKGQTQTTVTTSQPVIDRSKCMEEWAMVKPVVLAEQYPRNSMKDLWKLLYVYHKEEFPNLIILAQLALTSAVHTAGCERGFSAQNHILTKNRTRLLVETQHKLMSVKMASDINYSNVIKIWRNNKDRKLNLK